MRGNNPKHGAAIKRALHGVASQGVPTCFAAYSDVMCAQILGARGGVHSGKAHDSPVESARNRAKVGAPTEAPLIVCSVTLPSGASMR